MKKQNIIIVSIIALILVVAIGYALFAEALNIKGTATAQGNLEVKFTEIGEITKVGYTDVNGIGDEGIAEIKTIDGINTVEIKVNKLDYPGAYVVIPVTITNVGSVNAIVREIIPEGLTEKDRAVKVSYSGDVIVDKVMKVGESANMTIKVEWDSQVNDSASNINFKVKLNFVQSK